MEQEAEYKRNTQSQIQYSTLIVIICKYIMHNLNGSSLLLSEFILDKVFKLYLLYKKRLFDWSHCTLIYRKFFN